MRELYRNAALFGPTHGRASAAFGLACAFFAIAIYALFGAGSEPNLPGKAAPLPAIEAEGARSIIVREHGHKLWEFAAQRISLAADRSTASASNVRQGVLFRNGVPLWHLSAAAVRLDERTRNVDATGGVSASGPNGLSVRTVHAVWMQRAGRLVCPETVMARIKGLDINTGSAAYDVGKDELRCGKAVTARSSSVFLSSPQAVAHLKAGTVSFGGGVNLLFHGRNLPLLHRGAM